jgi:hypothetical protein
MLRCGEVASENAAIGVGERHNLDTLDCAQMRGDLGYRIVDRPDRCA